MGVACALVGALAGTFVALPAAGIGHGAFEIAAPLASLLCGAGAWWLIVVRRRRHTRWRGASAGALAVVTAHYLCWYFILFSAFVAQARSTTLSTGHWPSAALGTLVWAILPWIGSLFLLGWITVPAGMLLGAFLAARQRRAIALHDLRANPAGP